MCEDVPSLHLHTVRDDVGRRASPLLHRIASKVPKGSFGLLSRLAPRADGRTVNLPLIETHTRGDAE